MPTETVEALAFTQAVRALDAQSTALESLRTRAATILSAAALVTAFLGGLALAGPTLQNGEVQRAELTAWSWLGISSFLAVLLLSLVMLFPYKERFVVSATRILEGAAAAPAATVTDIQRDLARYLDANRTHNTKLLTRLFACFGVASIMLLVEAIAWMPTSPRMAAMPDDASFPPPDSPAPPPQPETPPVRLPDPVIPDPTVPVIRAPDRPPDTERRG